MAGGAAVAQMLQAEEESMTPYSPRDLEEDWEFKILRSVTGKFRDPEFQRAILAEEAKAGWRLVEKFDNTRLRLKRPASARQGDAGRSPDPYRIEVGMRSGALAALILACVFGFTGALILVVFTLVGIIHVR